MAMTITGKSEVVLALVGVTPSAVTLTQDRILQDLLHTWTAGTSGPGTLNAQKAVELTLTVGAPSVEIDLQTVLADDNLALALTELRLLVVSVVDNAEHRTLEISGGASNGVASLFAAVSGGKIPVGAGGVEYKSEPVVGYVIDGTHKTLKFARIGGGGTDVADLVVDVWIAGLRP